MHHFTTIPDYCQAINIPAPKAPHFDIRSFEENMPHVVAHMPPFRHEFYAIAIKADGEGKAITGHHTDFPEGTTIFFNSPFQVISWDIVPNWKGFYIMFSSEFLAQSKLFEDILQHFPFLKIDRSIPFTILPQDLPDILDIYARIRTEYHSDAADRFQLIEAYVYLLLTFVKRYFDQQAGIAGEQEIRSADLKLLSRYQALIETSFYPDQDQDKAAQPHSTSYYAQQLHVHPNHLNAVVKGLTGRTARQHIYRHVMQRAKAYLVQTEMTVKEIAYQLQFDSPNAFSTFFKKQEDTTPLAYRKAHLTSTV